jgi:hypothetical protein
VSVCQDGLVWLLEKGRFIATGTAGEYKSGEVVDGGEEEVAEPLVGCEGSGVESHVARVDLFVFFGGVCGLIEGRCSHPPFGLLSFLLLPCIKIWHACPRKKSGILYVVSARNDDEAAGSAMPIPGGHREPQSRPAAVSECNTRTYCQSGLHVIGSWATWVWTDSQYP